MTQVSAGARWPQAFVIAVGAGLVGLACFLYGRFGNPGPDFFKGRTLTRSTETLVPDPGS
jgi:hypothetical protein